MSKAKFTVSIFLALFLFAIINSSLGVLLTHYIDHYGLTESQQGLPASLLNVGCITALVTSMWVMGRVRKPRLMWIASAATVALLIPLGLPPAFALYAALFLLLGITVGYTDTMSSSSIADMYDGKNAVAVMCALHAVFGVAGIIAPLSFNALINAGLPWNGIYVVLLCVGAAMLMYIIPVNASRARQTTVQSTAGQKITREGIARFFKNRINLIIIISLFMYGLYLSAITIWIERYISVGLGSAGYGALSLSLFWLGLTLSRLIVPFIRIGPVKFTRWSALLASALLLTGIALNNALLMCVISALTGLCSGAVIPVMLHLVCRQSKANTMMATTHLRSCPYTSPKASARP